MWCHDPSDDMTLVMTHDMWCCLHSVDTWHVMTCNDGSLLTCDMWHETRWPGPGTDWWGTRGGIFTLSSQGINSNLNRFIYLIDILWSLGDLEEIWIYPTQSRFRSYCSYLIEVIIMYTSASYGGGNAWMKIMGIPDQGAKKKKDAVDKYSSSTR